MVSRIRLKRAIKRSAGLAAVAGAPLAGRSCRGSGCILAYHRVAALDFTDPSLDDWNVRPDRFERQIATLANHAEIVPLAEIRGRCDRQAGADRPLVALTFDDGYANFHSHVLPVLRRYQVPATVFVVTSLIDSKDPPPFDAWSVKHRTRLGPDAWRPLSWLELERCASSGLVTIGSHSHRHLKAPDCTPAMLAQEAEQSIAILQSRLGKVTAYAYPYGSSRLGYVPPSYARAVAAAGYDCAVTYDLDRVTSQTNPYLMPRIEAHDVDGPATIRAKAGGSLLPFRLTDRLRRAGRAA